MLICARERQLYSDAAIHIASVTFAFRCSNGTVLLVEAHVATAGSLTFGTTIPFPEQVLKPALLKLEHLKAQNLLDYQGCYSFEVKTNIGPRNLTRVKLVMVYVLFATKARGDLAAYFRPAKATMYPPTLSCSKYEI